MTVDKGGLGVGGRREKESGALDCAKRRNSSGRAAALEPLVMGKGVSCGGGEWWRTKLEFGSGKSFHDHHRSTAVGAESEVVRVGGCWSL